MRKDARIYWHWWCYIPDSKQERNVFTKSKPGIFPFLKVCFHLDKSGGLKVLSVSICRSYHILQFFRISCQSSSSVLIKHYSDILFLWVSQEKGLVAITFCYVSHFPLNPQVLYQSKTALSYYSDESQMQSFCAMFPSFFTILKFCTDQRLFWRTALISVTCKVSVVNMFCYVWQLKVSFICFQNIWECKLASDPECGKNCFKTNNICDCTGQGNIQMQNGFSLFAEKTSYV